MLTCSLLNKFVCVGMEVFFEETETLCSKCITIGMDRYEACISHKCLSMLMWSKAINNSLRTRFVLNRVDFVIRELI